MLKELQDIGLSEKEARVYLAALELGQTTAEKLAKQAKVNRSTTYVQLESLMKKGLISTFEEGKKTVFTPESPELLRRLLSRQRDEMSVKERDLAQLLPVLLQQFEGAGERPVVRFFPGKEGVTSVREEILTTKEKKIYVIFSPAHLARVYGGAELSEYSNRREALNIHSKGIYIYKEYKGESGLDPLAERRFLSPDILPLTINIVIFDDKTAILSLEGTLFGLVIESSQIAASMKAIFNFMWRSATRTASKK